MHVVVRAVGHGHRTGRRDLNIPRPHVHPSFGSACMQFFVLFFFFFGGGGEVVHLEVCPIL